MTVRIPPADLDRMRSEDHQRRLAELVAEMHLAPAPDGQRYGFPIPTCCGATVQDNTGERAWADFFGQRRIGDLVARISDAELNKLGAEVQQRCVPCSDPGEILTLTTLAFRLASSPICWANSTSSRRFCTATSGCARAAYPAQYTCEN